MSKVRGGSPGRWGFLPRKAAAEEVTILLHTASCTYHTFSFSCARLLQEGEDQLLDYEEEEANQEDKGAAAAEAGEAKKGHYVGVHSSGFRDFMLKPELQRAVVDCGCVPRWRVCGWVAAPMIPFLPLPPCQTHPILPTSPPASESHV